MTETDLHKLGLGHLLGTALLRAYMHGHFVDSRLYAKAVALAKPFAYEEYRQERIAAKVEEERQSRIAVVRKLPKVRQIPHRGVVAIQMSACYGESTLIIQFY